MGRESRRHIDVALGSITLVFGFDGRDVADGLQQSTMVEPVDPFERGALDGFEAGARARVGKSPPLCKGR